MDPEAQKRGRWLVLGQAVAGGALAVVWWLFPAPGWRLPALGLAVAGALLAVTAGLALGPAFRVGPEPRPEASLVRAGIYRWVRHPMYIGVLLAITAAVVSRPSGPVILVAFVNCAWYLLKAGFEEGRLHARYPEYEDYRRRTLGLPAVRRPARRRKP